MRRRAATRAAVLLLLVGLGLAGCGRDAPGAARDAVLHLDPRLADGRSSADVLGSLREVVRAYEGAEELSTLRTERLDTTPALEGSGLALASWRGPEPGGLVLGEAFDAGEVDVLELEARLPRDGGAWLRWRGEGDPPGEYARERALRVSVVGADEPVTLRFALRGHRAWNGEVRDLRIQLPPARGGSYPVLLSVRLVRLGYLADADGPEPGDEERGDGGFMTLEGVSVRSWPTDFDVPLLTRVRLPDGARLGVATAVSLGARSLDSGFVAFAVDVRPPGGSWENAGGLARPAARRGSWRPVAVDLSRFGGQEVELRLRAFHTESADLALGPGEGGALEHGDVLWGAPMVMGNRPPDRRPSIVLVTLDTMRADALGVLGDHAGTPALDALAAEGVTFANAWSTTNSTQPSHATILAGTFVKDHGVVNNYALLSGETETLAERLRAEGWATAAAVSQLHLGTKAGFGQGFDVFIEAHPKGHIDGGHAVGATRVWLDSLGAAKAGPVFLWVHLFDPHTPYTPPPEWLEQYAQSSPEPPRKVEPPTLPEVGSGSREHLEFLEGASSLEWVQWAYASGVAYADFVVGRLLDDLSARGVLDGAVVAVVADHGEGLGEHDAWFTHTGLFAETVHVPLILRAPGLPAGETWNVPVSTVDLAPTILAACGLEPGPRSRGVDLARLAGTGGDSARPVWFEHSDRIQVGLREGRFHAVLSMKPKMRSFVRVTGPDGRARLERVVRELPELTLFDHLADPDLSRDLSAERPELAAAYAERIRAWIDDAHARGGGARAISGEELDRLEHAGYAGAGE